MGLAASQARLLLLTAKNDSLEFQAQQIEEERLLLAQEQEVIASEYSEKTSNTIYVCSVTDKDGKTQSQAMDIESLAKSQGVQGGDGNAIMIADANGNPIAKAIATSNSDGTMEVSYEIWDKASNTFVKATSENNSIIYALKTNGPDSPLQRGLQNGAYQLFVQAPEDEANSEGTAVLGVDSIKGENAFSYKESYFVRKSPESLSNVTSRYYTEDDAAAQAEYTTALARVNALDTKLENKLNQVETQKKAVEQEMESVTSVRDNNIERTFQYFS